MKSNRDKPVKKTIKKRDFSQFFYLSAIDWDDIIASKANNIDDLLSSFYRKLNTVVNNHAPVKILSKHKIKQLAKLWITKGIRTSIKVKNKLYVNGVQSKYKYYRNKNYCFIRLSKRRYYFDFFEKNTNDMKKTWKAINELLNNQRRKSRLLTELKDPSNNNQITENSSRLPNILNEHIPNVGNVLASKLPNKDNCMSYLSKFKSPDSSFFFQTHYTRRSQTGNYNPYQIINPVAYTPALHNFLNVLVISYLQLFLIFLIYLLCLVVILQNLRFPK